MSKKFKFKKIKNKNVLKTKLLSGQYTTWLITVGKVSSQQLITQSSQTALN